MTVKSGYRGYVTSRPFLGERVPQHIQNLVIRDYAASQNMLYLLSATEYVMNSCDMMLQQVLAEQSEIEGVILYSIFQLPDRANRRLEVFRRLVKAGTELHAAVENIVMRTPDDAEHIETLWRVRTALIKCPSAADITAVLNQPFDPLVG